MPLRSFRGRLGVHGQQQVGVEIQPPFVCSEDEQCLGNSTYAEEGHVDYVSTIWYRATESNSTQRHGDVLRSGRFFLRGSIR